MRGPHTSFASPSAPLVVATDDVRRPDVLALLREHVAQLRSLTPAESCHVLDVEGLLRPSVRFYTVRGAGGELVGCGAWQDLGAAHAELKSMRTAEQHRCRGAAGVLLGELLASARRHGMRRVSLETGATPFFAPARRLYERHGFVAGPPFGGYVEDPESVFLTLVL